MNRTKIEYADYTWNPITGCLTGCPYCFAREIANRFGGWTLPSGKTVHTMLEGETGVLDEPLDVMRSNEEWQKAPFPYDFVPTLHRYRLDEPQTVKKPSTIFVGSMADMFAEWVPDEWIKTVLDACGKASHHTYLFLSKNSNRYYELSNGELDIIPDSISDYTPDWWFGASASTEADAQAAYENPNCSWMSLEPLHGEFSDDFFCGKESFDSRWDWIVVGAESGHRKGKVIPERRWITAIVEYCEDTGTPLFMKNSLQSVWAAPLIQELPW